MSCHRLLTHDDHEAEYGELYKWCEACRAANLCTTERDIQFEIDGILRERETARALSTAADRARRRMGDSR